MKNLVLALAIVGALSAVSSGFAQGPGRPGGPQGPGGMRGGPGGGNFMQMMRQREDKVFDQLHLNAQQKHKLEVLRKEREEKLKGLMAKGGRPDRNTMRAMREDYDKKLNGIFTKEQAAKYEKLRNEMRQQMRSRMGGPGGPGGPGGRPPGGR